ncbi:hypothetical protein SEA_EMOTION_73 [Arthrobacter phage Emotion]|uniref:Uncharacterized protein n=1 Tax=Arthrobacter phage Emotion TaxID=3038361 RepID=A0AA49ERR8_9CAUD|nr:hypothetical protein SEA_EMOTION_73 [Arthrobacter phage Emotion]
MAKLYIQVGPFGWLLESNLGRIHSDESSSDDDVEVHEVETETSLATGFQPNPLPYDDEEDG